MSGFYKKKHAATSRFWQENGFYVLLAVTLILLCVFAAFLFANDTQEPEKGNTEFNLPEDLPFETNSVLLPDPSNDQVAEVNTAVPDILKEPEKEVPQDPQTEPEQEPEPEEKEPPKPPTPVFYALPVSSDSILPYSGADPVFSETMNDWRTHDGIDYLTEGEEPVLAAADGIVEDVYTDERMGVTVVVFHTDNSRTIYQSLAPNPRVLKGTAVSQGDMLGRTGNTADNESLVGNHLHFAVLENGGYVDPNTRFSPQE